jgi:Holliday junction resolvasome RuvABC endonuclease subunit
MKLVELIVLFIMIFLKYHNKNIVNRKKVIVISRVLSVDQASILCGFAIMIDNKLINYGLIQLKEASEQYQKEIIKEVNRLKKNDSRFLYFETKNNGLLALREYLISFNPEFLVWEDLKTNINPDTIRLLGEYTGVLREYCQEFKINYREYIPASIRAKLCSQKTGKRGRGTKQDLARDICKQYDIIHPTKKDGSTVTSDAHPFFNVTDAIGVLEYHLKYGGKK